MPDLKLFITTPADGLATSRVKHDLYLYNVSLVIYEFDSFAPREHLVFIRFVVNWNKYCKAASGSVWCETNPQHISLFKKKLTRSREVSRELKCYFYLYSSPPPPPPPPLPQYIVWQSPSVPGVWLTPDNRGSAAPALAVISLTDTNTWPTIGK